MDRRTFLKSPTLLLVPAPSVETFGPEVTALTLIESFTSFKGLLSSLKACVLSHPGSKVLVSDDPMTRRIGYCVEAGQDLYLFDIAITDAGHSLKTEYEDKQQDALRAALRTSQGRLMLGRAFEKLGTV